VKVHWKQFTPVEINQDTCMARTWAGGSGGQCCRKKVEGTDFCATHTVDDKWKVHGRVDGEIPAKKLAEFAREGGKVEPTEEEKAAKIAKKKERAERQEAKNAEKAAATAAEKAHKKLQKAPDKAVKPVAPKAKKPDAKKVKEGKKAAVMKTAVVKAAKKVVMKKPSGKA